MTAENTSVSNTPARASASVERLATPEINHASAETAKVLEHAIGALADILGGWRYIRQSHGDLYGVGWDRCEKSASIAIAALRTEVEALATQRQGEGDGWQPIETAPKDGTHILIFEQHDTIPHEALWCDTSGWCGWKSWGWAAPFSDQDEQGGMFDFTPAYWMPLPAAPEGGNRSRG